MTAAGALLGFITDSVGIAGLGKMVGSYRREAQQKAAIEVIRAGKESGVTELEITLSEKAGLGIGSSIPGVPIEAIAGSSGTMTIKVKYKHEEQSDSPPPTNSAP